MGKTERGVHEGNNYVHPLGPPLRTVEKDRRVDGKKCGDLKGSNLNNVV